MDDHSGHKTGLSLTTMLALGGGALVAGIVLAPYIAPALGIGNINIAEKTLISMHNVGAQTSLAGTLNGWLAAIPGVGEELAKGGLTNIMATAATGLGGVALGNWVSKNYAKEGHFDWGKAIKWCGLATSALIALPSILTGLSNGLVYITNELMANKILVPVPTGKNIVTAIVEYIGTTPYQEPANLGFTGAAVTLPHLLTCGFSLFPFAAGVGANQWLVPESKVASPLPPGDRNHDISDEEKLLVSRYNDAPPIQKTLLRQEILSRGYDPDFHADGTVHLYRHTQHMASPAR